MVRAESVRSQLERILSHPLFSGADRRARLLRFLVEESLAGRDASLKEAVLAVEVFGRTGGYDPKVDSLVRVEMGRLRSRLIEYYATAGTDPVRIEIPKGSYQPVFTVKEPAVDLPEEASASVPHVSLGRAAKYAGAALPLLLAAAFLLWRGAPWMETGRPPSLAVLPFLNLSGDPGKEYLGDSITEELTEALAQSRNLRVVARTSAFQFKGKGQDVREIGRRLNVTDVLEGSLQLDGDQLRLVVQLIRSSDGYHVWSNTYETTMANLHLAEAEVAAATAGILSPAGKQAGAAKFPTTTNPQAHDLYLRAASFFHQGNPDSLRQALDLAHQAVQLDPSFARAHLLIAKSEQNLAAMNAESQQAAWERVHTSIDAVLALDPGSSEVHTLLALHDYVSLWDWPGAEREFQLALAAPAPAANAHNLYGWSLMTRKRFEEARGHFRSALEIDPLALSGARANLAVDWILERNYSRARQAIEDMFRLNPKSVAANGLLEWIQMIEGDCAGLRNTVQQVEPGNPADRRRTDAQIDALCGQPDRSRKILAELKSGAGGGYVSPYLLAEAYGMLGDREEAIDQLERAASARDSTVLYIDLDPLFDRIRGDARFQALSRRIGLVP